MNLELRHLRAFASVVEHGGYTRAARALGVSQSTVSEAVAALERRIGEPLLKKSGRGIAPTDAGALVLETARAMLDAEVELDRKLAGRATAHATMRLGANESVSSYLLPDALASARERWPRHDWTVTLGNCAALREKLRHGDIDAAFIVEPAGAHEGVDARADSLRGVELALFAARGSALARAKQVSLADVQKQVIVLSDAAGTYERLLRAKFERAGLPAPRVSAMGTVESVKRWVAENVASTGVLPRFAIASELAAGTVVALRLETPLPRLELRLVAPAEMKPPIADVAAALRDRR